MERLQVARPNPAPRGPTASSLFARGFVVMLPLGAGAIPVGIAYGVAARAAGLSAAEAQLMSLLVFSAAAQVSAVAQLEVGASVGVLIGTAVSLNAQLILLGLAVGRQVRASWPRRLVTAWFLTDGAYGVAATRGPLRLPVLVGAGVSMYVAWNAGTALGTLAGRSVPGPRGLGIDFIVPLAFLAVLVPLVRTHAALVVALSAGAATLVLARLAPGGVAVLGAGVVGSAAGAWWSRRADRSEVRAAAPIGEGQGS
jgi:predicted branched-subunit amino acid permease